MDNLHNASAHLQELDARHHLHPFSDAVSLAKRGARVITKAEGVYLWDCLLYTSPSPRDQRGSRMPSSA